MKNKGLNCFVSFFLSFICLTIIFALLKIIGGQHSMFQGDDFQQYLVFITDFIRDIKSGQSVWYSFSNYIGSGNILTVAYYCLSPFNVLFYICGDNFYLAYFLIVTLKISISAASFCFYISKFTKRDRVYYIIASIFYALSGYAVTWYIDIMWLDALYIMPLLIIFIIRFVKTNKYLVLITLYAYLFVTNFYMGFIVGVFSALFFVLFLIYDQNYVLKGRVIYYFKKILGFGGAVLLSAGMCAGLLAAVAGFLSEHMAHDNVEFNSLVANFLDIVNSMFLGEFQTMDNQVPILYAGLPTMALVFFFFANKSIHNKDKIFWGGQLSFYVIGMIFLPLYKFLHAFDYPNFYGYRFSFVVVFILVTISCFSFERVKLDGIDYFKGFIIIAPIFYSIMMTFQVISFGGNRLNDQSGLLINSLFIIAWFLLIYIYVGKDSKNKIVKIGAVVLASLELIINGYICIKNTDFVFIEKSLINGWYYSEKTAIDSIEEKDDSFYRIYVNNDVNTNSGKMFGYNGLNTFSSADNYELRMALCRLGQSTSNRYLRSNCSVPGFDSLFAVKYYVDLPRYEEYINMQIDSDNYISGIVKENEYALSLGYMVSEEILQFDFSDNAFDNIDRLCDAMTGVDYNVYNYISLDEDMIALNNYRMDIIENRLYFTHITDSEIDAAGVAFIVPEYSDYRYMEFSYNSPGSYSYFPTVYTDEEGAYHSKLVAEGGVYKMGQVDGDNYVTLGIASSLSPDFFVNSINVADYNEDEFIKVYENLSQNQYNITQNTDDVISGTVVATEEKPYLFTTIPYDPEWHIYVDGQPISKLYRVVGDAFMAIELAPGEHTVTFQYIEKWSNEGMIISLVCISVFCVLVMINLLKRKKDTKMITEHVAGTNDANAANDASDVNQSNDGTAKK